VDRMRQHMGFAWALRSESAGEGHSFPLGHSRYAPSQQGAASTRLA
jgi:hypothetical protein